jgi:hypothetical protein
MLQGMEKEFTFQGETLSYMKLKSYETIKVYIDSSHHDRTLKKSPEGKLYLYIFDEYMNFSGPDIMNELFIPVPDEQTADELSKENELSIRAGRPHIHVPPNWEIKVHG